MLNTTVGRSAVSSTEPRRTTVAQRRRFLVNLASITVAALVFRLLYVALWAAPADNRHFHLQANLLAKGYGYIAAGQFAASGRRVITAGHPPLFSLILAGVSYLGGTSVFAHQVTCCVLSAATVLVIGFIGRDLAGESAGLFAAGLASLYPPLWMNDNRIFSESLFALLIAIFLWAAYRFCRRPRLSSAVIMGVTVGLGALTRGEATLVLAVVAAPLVLMVKGLDRPARVRQLVAVLLSAAVVVAPWTIRNLATFKRPVLLSTDGDGVIGGANCPSAYYGPGIGDWHSRCVKENLAGINVARLDESQVAAIERRKGVVYALHHVGRWPAVVAARVGRTLNLFHPLRPAADYEHPTWLNLSSALLFFILQPFAVRGAVWLRRHGRALWPLLGQAVVVMTVAIVFEGKVRLRTPWDVAIVVLGGVALAALAGRLGSHRRRTPSEGLGAT